jgi:hypothetical protein
LFDTISFLKVVTILYDTSVLGKMVKFHVWHELDVDVDGGITFRNVSSIPKALSSARHRCGYE